MKRLYADAAVVEGPDGFAIALDGKPIKSPGRRPVVLPTGALAAGIAREWREQGTNVLPYTMPLMQLAATVIDGIATNRAAIEAAILRFAETDLVCYRADGPPGLAARQRALWDPLLEWLAARTGVALSVTTGLLPVEQSRQSIKALAQIVGAMDDWTLGAFQAAAAASGSFVLALALIEGRIDTDDGFKAAELDENFGIEKWGADPDATVRLAGIAFDLDAARRFRDLLKG
jgi:chaperone required for assembly of F1-ATPase